MAEPALNTEGVEGAAEKNRRLSMKWLVCIIGFTTTCMAVASAIYKVPTGIFNDHKLAYYVSIVSAGAVGLAEVFAAVIWMPDSGGHHPHGLARRCALFASFVPLAFIVGLGGVRMLLK